MKVLFITQYFYPEIFKGNDIAFDFAQRGDEVTVVTAIPNYPKGKFFKGYGYFKKNSEIVNGVRIVRVPVIPRGSAGSIRLVLNYFSYLLSACFYVVFLALFKKFDIVFVQQLSPVTMSFPGVVFKKIQKKPLYTWVLDLWPESLSFAGGVNNKYILYFFDLFVKFEYKNSDKILISSKKFKDSIINKGSYENKLVYFPNWAEDVFTSSKMGDVVMPELPDGFIVMFAGNIGEAQDFEHIMEVALALKKEKKIKFVIIGDGRKKKWLDDFVQINQLNDTVICLGRFPIHTMPVFFERADVMLVTLKNDEILNLTAPAKLQAYMASRKAVLGMISGEAKSLIEESKCGLCAEAGDVSVCVRYIRELALLQKEELIKMGVNGYEFYLKHFDKNNSLNRLYCLISEMKKN